MSISGVSEREFFKPLPDGAAIRVKLTLEHGRVLAFTAQYEIWTGERWKPVVRYDSAHNRSHRDTLDWNGKVIEKDWFAEGTSNDEALQEARRDLIANADTYRAAFEEKKPK